MIKAASGEEFLPVQLISINVAYPRLSLIATAGIGLLADTTWLG